MSLEIKSTFRLYKKLYYAMLLLTVVNETQALCSWGTMSHHSEMGSLLFKQMITIGHKYLAGV